MTLKVVLYEPEIPPNTGNIVRLCANTGAELHLIEPLGFDWDDRKLRRAGLDYHEFARVSRHASLADFHRCHAEGCTYAFSTKGHTGYTQAQFGAHDALLFGPETRGLPDEVLNSMERDRILRIPMRMESRSLNLSNAVAVALYEAWRQQNFR